MSSTPYASMGVVSAVAKVGTGVEQQMALTQLGSIRVGQTELSRSELARTGRLFAGGLTLIANGIVPVVDLPTTTAPFAIYNTVQSGANARCLVLDRVSVAIASGTTGAAGFTLFCGVSASPLATALTANGTGVKIQATRGSASSVAFGASAQTVAAGSCYTIVGGIMTTAVAVTGCGYSTTVDGSFIAQPGYALLLGILGDTGTTAKYLVQAIWAECEMDCSV